MAGTETKRIIELTEASTVQSGDFIAVDSNARGTKKVSTDALATSAALTAETNARTGADEQMSERMDGIEEQTALIQNPTKTLSGALVSFTDGAEMPMVACTASIVPKQSGTGTPSPDNVRPISGWESVNVYKSGKNLFDKDSAIVGFWDSNGTYTANDSYRTIYVKVKPNTTYAVSGISSWDNWRLCYFDSLTPTTFTQRNITIASTFTTTNDTVLVSFSPSASSYGDGNGVQVEEGSTATDYEPYTGTTTPVSLGHTVYGGTLDVVSGVLTVDRAIVDGGSLNWTYWTASAYYATVNNKTAISVDDIQSDIYPTKTVLDANVPNGIMCSISSEAVKKFIYIVDGDVADATALKTKLTGHQICYRINNPQTYQLTPTVINTLLGENNVWADAGSVEITYRRDISIVINNLESALNG